MMNQAQTVNELSARISAGKCFRVLGGSALERTDFTANVTLRDCEIVGDKAHFTITSDGSDCCHEEVYALDSLSVAQNDLGYLVVSVSRARGIGRTFMTRQHEELILCEVDARGSARAAS